MNLLTSKQADHYLVVKHGKVVATEPSLYDANATAFMVGARSIVAVFTDGTTKSI